MFKLSSKSPAKASTINYPGSKPSLPANFRKSPLKEASNLESFQQCFEKGSKPDATSAIGKDFVPSPIREDSMEVSNDVFESTSNNNEENLTGSFFGSSHNDSEVFSGFGSGKKGGNDLFGGAKNDEGWKLDDSPGGFFFGDNSGEKDDGKGFSFNFGGSKEEDDAFSLGGSFTFGGEDQGKGGGSFSFF